MHNPQVTRMRATVCRGRRQMIAIRELYIEIFPVYFQCSLRPQPMTTPHGLPPLVKKVRWLIATPPSLHLSRPPRFDPRADCQRHDRQR